MATGAVTEVSPLLQQVVAGGGLQAAVNTACANSDHGAAQRSVHNRTGRVSFMGFEDGATRSPSDPGAPPLTQMLPDPKASNEPDSRLQPPFTAPHCSVQYFIPLPGYEVAILYTTP